MRFFTPDFFPPPTPGSHFFSRTRRWSSVPFHRNFPSGITSVALDLSPDMQKYGLAKGKEKGAELLYYVEDMIDFSLPLKFDLVALLLNSVSYILSVEDFLHHLACVAKHLTPEGIYILEFSHPKDIFTDEKTAQTKWEMEREGTRVSIEWGSEKDTFDPIGQITQTTVRLKGESPQGEVIEIEEIAPQKCYTAPEVEALVLASGKFELVERFGSLDRKVPFDNEKGAWRMICVLKLK